MPVNNIPIKSQNLDATNEYFNNYFSEEATAYGTSNDILIGFFEELTNDKEAARILAGSVISTAQAQQLDVMQLVSELQGQDKQRVNTYLIALLNLNRVNTSLLGVTSTPVQNSYVTRLIV